MSLVCLDVLLHGSPHDSSLRSATYGRQVIVVFEADPRQVATYQAEGGDVVGSYKRQAPADMRAALFDDLELVPFRRGYEAKAMFARLQKQYMPSASYMVALDPVTAMLQQNNLVPVDAKGAALSRKDWRLARVKSGSFGTVVRIRGSDQVVYAFKILVLKDVLKVRPWRSVYRELSAMTCLKHDSVVRHMMPQVYPVRQYSETDSCGISHVGIMTELCEGGDLLELVQKSGKVPPPQAEAYAEQLLSGVAYLHGLGIIHRDIKLDNLLLRGGQLKIADFGESLRDQTNASAPTEDTVLMSMRAVRGAACYAPPEMCLKDFKKFVGMVAPGGDDVYRSGLVIIELFTGVVLESKIRDMCDTADPACHPHVWDKVVGPLLAQAAALASAPLRALLSTKQAALLTLDPRGRISASGAVTELQMRVRLVRI